jgi:hypothetical protein
MTSEIHILANTEEHVASLFPATVALHEQEHLVVELGREAPCLSYHPLLWLVDTAAAAHLQITRNKPFKRRAG